MISITKSKDTLGYTATYKDHFVGKVMFFENMAIVDLDTVDNAVRFRDVHNAPGMGRDVAQVMLIEAMKLHSHPLTKKFSENFARRLKADAREHLIRVVSERTVR